MSVAYCKECLEANAHPWHILIANTACIEGGLKNTASWWQEMVLATCKHLGRTVENFNQQVEQAEKDLDALVEQNDG